MLHQNTHILSCQKYHSNFTSIVQIILIMEEAAQRCVFYGHTRYFAKCALRHVYTLRFHVLLYAFKRSKLRDTFQTAVIFICIYLHISIDNSNCRRCIQSRVRFQPSRGTAVELIALSNAPEGGAFQRTKKTRSTAELRTSLRIASTIDHGVEPRQKTSGGL